MLVFLLLASACVVAVTSSHGCDNGWEYYAGSKTCFKVTTKRYSFPGARMYCRQYNSDLVISKDRLKTSWLTSKVFGSYWNGLQDPFKNGKFAWVDGKPLSGPTHWAAGEPSNLENSQYCVKIGGSGSSDPFGWFNADCRFRLRVICEKKAPSPECKPGYHLYEKENICMKGFAERKPFVEARKACKAEGGDLAVVKDQEKASFVTSIHKPNYWMGLRDFNWRPHSVQTFKYMDQSLLSQSDYHPWYSGQPDNRSYNEMCVLVYGPINSPERREKWFDLNCKVPAAYVCEMKRN